uniref:EF-hand domain-containing protein n=1 Tax=Alexandrium catenella TaxID=2925 RepID=A0A7S1R513_ALECA|mmetsp:Transcript_4489/g.12015  ORF Transcript_4489/g.12015 Transcript_4489/m.12015 type:complete len:219 (+) Transcript_4489:67-723(+)
MAAAAGAIVGARRALAERSRPPIALSTEQKARIHAEVKAQSKRRKYALLLAKYDTDQSGKLNKDQMMKLLTDLETASPGGHPPTDEELDWIIKFADTGGSWLGFSDGEISCAELEAAVVAYLTYIDNRDLLDTTFDQFDTNETGQLAPSELKDYLTALNGGEVVTDEEVAWVLGMADVTKTGTLCKPETMMATLEWFNYVETGHKTRPSQRKECCLVM